MPNVEKQPIQLHPSDAATIKETLSRMVVEYHTLADNLGREEKEEINFMYVQLTSMINACTAE